MVIEHIMEFEFHVDRTLADHRRGGQLALEQIEQGSLVGSLARHDAAIVGFRLFLT